MGYKPRKLGHVSNFVCNAESSRDWYEDFLNLHNLGITPGRAAFMTSDLGTFHETDLVELGNNSLGLNRGK